MGPLFHTPPTSFPSPLVLVTRRVPPSPPPSPPPPPPLSVGTAQKLLLVAKTYFSRRNYFREVYLISSPANRRAGEQQLGLPTAVLGLATRQRASVRELLPPPPPLPAADGCAWSRDETTRVRARASSPTPSPPPSPSLSLFLRAYAKSTRQMWMDQRSAVSVRVATATRD
jgi:hypothetical protein